MSGKVQTLIDAALKAQQAAYAPYSNHPVGVALMTDDGRVFSGCNVENAAFPLGMCAEAAAIAAMMAGGGQSIAQMVIAGPGATPCAPCGGCRQRIYEFAGVDGTHIAICDGAGTVLLETTITDLLPYAFGPANVRSSGGKP